MSVEAITWALRVPIGGNAKVVLLGLANHAHPDGSQAFPAVETLAVYACCDPRSVQRNLRKLETEGWIARAGEGPRGTTCYRLAMSGGDRLPPPTPLSPRGDAGVAERMTLVSPEPSIEPSGTVKSAREQAAGSLPGDFPDELREHARRVYVVLRRVAELHNAREVKPLALGQVIMARPRKPLVKAAHDFAAWAADPPRPIADVVASYRNWLDRERDLQTFERLTQDNGGAGAARYTRED